MKRYQLPVEKINLRDPLHHFPACVRGWNTRTIEESLTQANDVELLRFREYILLLPYPSFSPPFFVRMRFRHRDILMFEARVPGTSVRQA